MWVASLACYRERRIVKWPTIWPTENQTPTSPGGEAITRYSPFKAGFLLPALRIESSLIRSAIRSGDAGHWRRPGHRSSGASWSGVSATLPSMFVMVLSPMYSIAPLIWSATADSMVSCNRALVAGYSPPQTHESRLSSSLEVDFEFPDSVIASSRVG